MPVTSSSLRQESPQKDGSRWVREIHQVTGGESLDAYYLAAKDADAAAIMASRVAGLNAILAESEAQANIERDGAPTLLHMTAAQFADRLREMFRSAERERAACLAWWMLRRIAAGQITDAQARTAFAMTATQWTNFKAAKLQPRADAWAAVIASTAE